MDPPVRIEEWESSVCISGSGRPSQKSTAPPTAGKYAFNWAFIKGLWRLMLCNKRRDLVAVFILVGLIALNLWVGSQSGKVTGQFYGSIVDKKWDVFLKVLWKSALVVIGSALLESLIKFTLDIIAFRWRKNLVAHVHERYFSDSMFYQVLHLDGTIDNPYVQGGISPLQGLKAPFDPLV